MERDQEFDKEKIAMIEVFFSHKHDIHMSCYRVYNSFEKERGLSA